jgi:ribosomal protein S27E
MAITFACKCGQTLQVEREHAGAQVQCPTCDTIVTAPAAGLTLVTRVVRPARRDDEDEQERDKSRHGSWSGTEKWVLSGGVIGGLLAMLVAVVWFVRGLMADRVFFYPPILFVVGLVGVAKGLMSGSDD